LIGTKLVAVAMRFLGPLTFHEGDVAKHSAEVLAGSEITLPHEPAGVNSLNKKQQKTSILSRFFVVESVLTNLSGGEGGIRTLAPDYSDLHP
jgi:hypothetical protein